MLSGALDVGDTLNIPVPSANSVRGPVKIKSSLKAKPGRSRSEARDAQPRTRYVPNRNRESLNCR